MEPHGVLLFSESFFQDWLEGYRAVREFSEENESAVYLFAIIGAFRNIVCKLGFADSSRGKPLLEPDALLAVIDDWLMWERNYLQVSPGRKLL